MIRKNNKGFTLIEILIVITIIAILTAIVSATFTFAKEKAYFSKAKLQSRSFEKALESYVAANNNQFPPDANRNIPPGLEEYLNSTHWPDGPWPGSIYDWDHWNDPQKPGAKIYQISIRFCPVGGPLTECNFPKTDWAKDFGINSAVYYCIEGSCRSHIGENQDYPGYCLNCSED